MEYSEDHNKIAEWAPLIIDGRDDTQPIAATRIITGTDVDYGALTHLLANHLSAQPGFDVHYNRKVVGLDRGDDGRWRVSVEDTYDGGIEAFSAKFVFVGAGGGALPLLQKPKIPEGKGYRGFPVSGIWLRCDVDAVSQRHHAKVYGKAASGSPPMSVPHLDTRIIGGKRSLLFGPYAGFSTRFLKHGSLGDLLASLAPQNIVPLLDVARDNVTLSEYLIGQVLESSNHQFATVKQFFPRAMKHEEGLEGGSGRAARPNHQATRNQGLVPPRGGCPRVRYRTGGRRRQVYRGAAWRLAGCLDGGRHRIDVLERCFAHELTESAWLPNLKEIIPTYGIDLKQDAEACRQTRAETATILKIENV
jgi:malate dehydrogenase (quinone)